MTNSGWICLRARRVAMRRISCIDQRIRDSPCWATIRRRFAPHPFWGWRDGVGVNADRSHHRESEHDERHVTPPAVPGARLVVIEAEFVLGGFKAVFDRPAMALDFCKLFDGRFLRRPGREEGEVAVRDLAADQEAARPCLAFECLAVFDHRRDRRDRHKPNYASARPSFPRPQTSLAQVNAGRRSAISFAVPAMICGLSQE